jgi:hypothetical protein
VRHHEYELECHMLTAGSFVVEAIKKHMIDEDVRG